MDSRKKDTACDQKEFDFKIKSEREFYQLVSSLDTYIGKGNWTTRGRPLRHIRRFIKLRHYRFHVKIPMLMDIKIIVKNNSTAINLVMLKHAGKKLETN